MVGFRRDENAMTVNRRYPRLTILQVDAHRDLQLAHLKDGQRDKRLHHHLGADHPVARSGAGCGRPGGHRHQRL